MSMTDTRNGTIYWSEKTEMSSPFRIEVRGNKHSLNLICSELPTTIPKNSNLAILTSEFCLVTKVGEMVTL
jgi:hypothetical protein